MQLIVGHTTNNSAWIWVRGDRSDRHFEVELEQVSPPASDDARPPVRRVSVRRADDYTGVVRFDSVLEHSTRYKVKLRSLRLTRYLDGQLRTFPERDHPVPFRFLHGSCNLSAPRLTALAATALGAFGSAATNNALKLPPSEWDPYQLPFCLRLLGRPPLRWLFTWLVKWMNVAVVGFTRQTRFEQPKVILTDSGKPEALLKGPFKAIADGLSGTPEDPRDPPAFMIHCGDQIYYDVDFPPRRGKKRDYRRNYRQAWFDDDGTAEVLRSLPHYMILDDHEIVDGFGTEPRPKCDCLRKHALIAYHEYVASRQPCYGESLYYSFEHGDTAFFVLDTRTERSPKAKRMINEKQLDALDGWLGDRKQYGLRFIVSSVPFVAEVRPPGLDAVGERHDDERADKWSGPLWRSQRERIIAMIHKHEIERLVFLVGDMHCTYHARMQIGEPRKRITVHELAGGPLSQVSFGTRDRFYDRYHGTFNSLVDPGAHERKQVVLPWTSTLEEFNGSAPSVLEVSVTPESGDVPLEVQWRARTHPAPPGRSVSSKVPKPQNPHHLCGRIRFHRKSTEAS